MILLYISIILFLVYSMLVIYYAVCWNGINMDFPTPPTGNLRVAVIIPARNEEAGIGRLLEAIEQQDYPRHLIETIVIDDDSTDSTADIVRDFPYVKLISLKADNINSYKKKAIETGIDATDAQLIVTTDADCLPSPKWLSTIVTFKEKTDAVFVAAPVSIDCNSDIVQVFQSMDFMVLQGITGAAVNSNQLSMCNGANLAYEREAFYAVNGFSGIDLIASGDDMLLMHKIAAAYPGRIHYLKSRNAIVSAQPMKTWKEFFNQRIRWASKAVKYDDKRIFAVLLVVYLFNVSLAVLFIGGFFNYYYWFYFLGGWVLKTLVELPLFYSVAVFFNKKWAIPYFFFFQPLHILYTIASGLFGQFGKYEWKGRKVR